MYNSVVIVRALVSYYYSTYYDATVSALSSLLIGAPRGSLRVPEFIVNVLIPSILRRVSVITNNVNWGVSGIEGESVIDDVLNKAKSLGTDNLSSIISNSSDFPTGSLPAINEGQRLLQEKCLNISKSNDSYNTIVVR